jgi:phage FluMu protein Com
MLMTFPNAARVQPKINIRDYRCQSCGRLLFRAHIPYIPGVRIEIRCTRMIIVESGEVKNVTKEPGQ